MLGFTHDNKNIKSCYPSSLLDAGLDVCSDNNNNRNGGENYDKKSD